MIQRSASRGLALRRAASRSTIARPVASCWVGVIALAARICSGVGPGMAAVAVDGGGAAGAGRQAPGEVDIVALGDRDQSRAHLPRPDLAGGRVAQQGEEVVDRASMVAALVPDRGEIEARLRIARLQLERAPEELLGFRRRRPIGAGRADQQHLGQIGGIIGVARLQLHRPAEGLGGVGEALHRAIGHAEQEPALMIVGIFAHPLRAGAPSSPRPGRRPAAPPPRHWPPPPHCPPAPRRRAGRTANKTGPPTATSAARDEGDRGRRRPAVLGCGFCHPPDQYRKKANVKSGVAAKSLLECAMLK